jgi:hypothetical protein
MRKVLSVQTSSDAPMRIVRKSFLPCSTQSSLQIDHAAGLRIWLIRCVCLVDLSGSEGPAGGVDRYTNSTVGLEEEGRSIRKFALAVPLDFFRAGSSVEVELIG